MPIKNIGIPKTGKLHRPGAMPNLSLIGVPESMQQRPPMIGSYPDKFNQDARWVWKKMFSDDAFKEELRSDDDADLQWHSAIVEFLRRCEQDGVMPFHPNTQQELTDAVVNSLNNARIYLKNFIDGIGLFERVKVLTACREYHIKEHGTAVISWATLRNVRDPFFEKWLTQKPNPGLVMSTAQQYQRLIQSNILVSVKYINQTRVTVKYEIQIGTPISVPGKRLATKKEAEDFMDRVVWLPIVRAHRFRGLKNRLF